MSNEAAPQPTGSWVDLSGYTPGDYRPGRGKFVQVLWYMVSVALFESGWFPLTRLKPAILRAFGAQIGRGVVIKPNAAAAANNDFFISCLPYLRVSGRASARC